MLFLSLKMASLTVISTTLVLMLDKGNDTCDVYDA